MIAMLASAVYLLCAATSTGCMLLLMRSYSRTRSRLLLWSMLCFVGLAANNLLLFTELVLFPHIDLRWPRHLTALAAVSVLLYGFIWEAD
jgi:hypothetical protein